MPRAYVLDHGVIQSQIHLFDLVPVIFSHIGPSALSLTDRAGPLVLLLPQVRLLVLASV